MAPPRKRTSKNRHLPENLYPNGNYWRYRNPITGAVTSINKSMEEAIRLARAANARLAPLMVDDGKLLSQITGERAPTVNHLIDRFNAEWLPTRRLAESTVDEMKIKLARYKKDLGERMVGQLDVLAMADYLDQFTNNAYTKHRALWVYIMDFAVAKGMAERNSAELTLVKQEDKKRRRRHTVEGINKILAASTTPPWLKRAIRLALLSLQRREDVVTWERSAVDLSRNVIRVSAGKTENYQAPVHLEIEMGDDLRQVVAECLATPIASPYLICYMPKRRRRDQMDAKLHWSAVTEDYFTKEFRKARDACGAYDHIEDTLARPTVHELRALGSWMYDKQGFSVEYVQQLMGHADEEMTTFYQEGHEVKEIEYRHVQAGLKL